MISAPGLYRGGHRLSAARTDALSTVRTPTDISKAYHAVSGPTAYAAAGETSRAMRLALLISATRRS
jgi:hypothetical protein